MALCLVFVFTLTACASVDSDTTDPFSAQNIQILAQKVDGTSTSSDAAREIANFVADASGGLVVIPRAETVSYGLIGDKMQERAGVHYTVFVTEDPLKITLQQQLQVRDLVGRLFQLSTQYVLLSNEPIIDIRIQVVTPDIEFRQSTGTALFIATREDLLGVGDTALPQAWLQVTQENKNVLMTEDTMRVVYDPGVTQRQKQTIEFSLQLVRTMFGEAGIVPEGTMYVVTSAESFVERAVSSFTSARDLPEDSPDYLELVELSEQRSDSVRGIAFPTVGVIIINISKIRSELYELAHVTVHEWAHFLQSELLGELHSNRYVYYSIPSQIVEVTADMLAHYAVTYAVCEGLTIARNQRMPLKIRECTSEVANRKLLAEYYTRRDIFDINAKLLKEGEDISSVYRFFTEYRAYAWEFFGGNLPENLTEDELLEFYKTAFSVVFERVFGKSLPAFNEELSGQ